MSACAYIQNNDCDPRNQLGILTKQSGLGWTFKWFHDYLRHGCISTQKLLWYRGHLTQVYVLQHAFQKILIKLFEQNHKRMAFITWLPSNTNVHLHVEIRNNCKQIEILISVEGPNYYILFNMGFSYCFPQEKKGRHRSMIIYETKWMKELKLIVKHGCRHVAKRSVLDDMKFTNNKGSPSQNFIQKLTWEEIYKHIDGSVFWCLYWSICKAQCRFILK